MGWPWTATQDSKVLKHNLTPVQLSACAKNLRQQAGSPTLLPLLASHLLSLRASVTRGSPGGNVCLSFPSQSSTTIVVFRQTSYNRRLFWCLEVDRMKHFYSMFWFECEIISTWLTTEVLFGRLYPPAGGLDIEVDHWMQDSDGTGAAPLLAWCLSASSSYYNILGCKCLQSCLPFHSRQYTLKQKQK